MKVIKSIDDAQALVGQELGVSQWLEIDQKRINDFADVTDFIGWYGSIGERKYGIPKTDAYAFYLAYHEGHAGYARGSYKRNSKLLATASKVAKLSRQYQRQLDSCQPDASASRGSGASRG